MFHRLNFNLSRPTVANLEGSDGARFGMRRKDEIDAGGIVGFLNIAARRDVLAMGMRVINPQMSQATLAGPLGTCLREHGIEDASVHPDPPGHYWEASIFFRRMKAGTS